MLVSSLSKLDWSTIIARFGCKMFINSSFQRLLLQITSSLFIKEYATATTTAVLVVVVVVVSMNNYN